MGKKNICCVYKITNIVNNLYYIGSTKSLKIRIYVHLSNLKKGTHHNFKLQKDFKKYGIDKFKFSIVKRVDRESNLQREEQKILDGLDYKKVYNISKKAGGGDLISDHPKYKQIIKKTKKGLEKARLSEKWRSAILDRKGEKNSAFGVPWSIERKKKAAIVMKKRMAQMSKKEKIKYAKNISKKQKLFWNSPKGQDLKKNKSIEMTGINNHFYGKKHSKKTINKIIKKLKGVPNLKCSKKIIINGKIYRSQAYAAKILGLPQQTISYRVRSKNSKYKKWAFIQDNE